VNINGIEITENTDLIIKNWPFGLNLKVIARLTIKNGKTNNVDLTEISSEIKEENLLTEIFKIKVPKTGKKSFLTEIISGKFKGAMVFFKTKKEND